VISILIIEDNPDKLRNISREITSIPSITVENITHASTLSDARNLLRAHTYDLLILDIMIPNRIDQMPSLNSSKSYLRKK
jgi:response regulator of citrate/malate metabolism